MTYLTMNGRPSRVLTILSMFGGIAARCGRCAEGTNAYSDRADGLNPNIVKFKVGLLSKARAFDPK